MPEDISTPLPQLSLREETIIEVATGNAAVPVTRMVIHGWQDDPADAQPVPAPLLAVQPSGKV